MRGLTKLSLEKKNRYFGLFFIMPWMAGFLLLFLFPLLSSFRYSLSKLQISNDGYTLDYIGLDNYRNILTVHESFVRTLTGSVVDIAVNVPLIVIFSLFTAVLLNQKFRGRALARAIFFLPVILASGIIAEIESGDLMQAVMRSTSEESGSGLSMLRSFELAKLLVESGVSMTIVDYLTNAVNRIYQIISQSGVQILIFLAGLQSISPALYEASRIEGATGYEAFWKITFPMISPLMLTNVIYTIIDSFLNNQTSRLIMETAFGKFDFGLSASMSWLYFAVISMILWVVAMLISRNVFYYD